MLKLALLVCDFRNDKIHRISFAQAVMNKIAMINRSMEEVIFNTSPVKNSQIRSVSSVSIVVVNSPFTKNIIFDNKGIKKIVNNRPISNVSDLTINKDLSGIKVG